MRRRQVRVSKGQLLERKGSTGGGGHGWALSPASLQSAQLRRGQAGAGTWAGGVLLLGLRKARGSVFVV